MGIHKQQLDFVYRQLSYVQVASFIGSLFLLILLWGSVNNFWLGVWFAVLSVISTIRSYSAYCYQRCSHTPGTDKLFKILYISGAFLGGLAWGSSIFFLNHVDTQHLQFGIVLIIAGITTGAISSNAIILTSYLLFQLPILSHLVIWLLNQQTASHNKLAIATIFYVVLLTILAKKYRDNLTMLYESQEKNQDLINELQKEIQARKESEIALRKSELRFHNLLDAAPDAMVITNEEGNIVMVNQEAVSLFGYSEEELINREIEILVPQRFGDHKNIRNKYTQVSDIGKYNIYPSLYAQHKDGHEIPVEIKLNTISFVEGKLISSSIRDISKHILIEDELNKARKQAEKTNQAKSDFIASMNHELRTPLNAIMGFSQVLQLADNMTDEQKSQLAEINNAGKHLLRLTSEMQDISRIESGSIELHCEAVNISEVIYDCLSFTQPMAEKNHIKLELVTSICNDVCVYADKTRFRQIILNLLSNAIKYNSANGNVTIHCKLSDKSHIQISITDTGPGFAPEQLASLYQPYNRLGAEKTKVEGTGIGLSISKKLLELMDGDIQLDTNPGFGSTFSITLPLARPQAAENTHKVSTK